MNYSIIRTRLGYFGVAFSKQGIAATVLPKQDLMEVQLELANRLSSEFLVQVKPPKELEKIFTDYFSGRHANLTRLPVDLRGSDFEKEVWKACMEIPFGEVRSYSWIARKIKKYKASRAVGNALGKNPVAPIVPCHRVVSTTGIGGFSAGLAIKRQLLELETR